jgi:hypothetical protein
LLAGPALWRRRAIQQLSAARNFHLSYGERTNLLITLELHTKQFSSIVV